jgi:hypothetical protein
VFFIIAVAPPTDAKSSSCFLMLVNSLSFSSEAEDDPKFLVNAPVKKMLSLTKTN